MKVTQAIEVMKKESVGQLFAYPVNPIIEAAADIDIRPIIVRQERTGIHMADSVSRLSSGREVGVFVCQNGPGAENAFGGIAQCYAESVPLVFMPGGMARAQMDYFPKFSSQLNYQHITKSAEVLTNPASVWDALRRAFISQTMMSPGCSLLASETSRTTFCGTRCRSRRRGDAVDDGPIGAPLNRCAEKAGALKIGIRD